MHRVRSIIKGAAVLGWVLLLAFGLVQVTGRLNPSGAPRAQALVPPPLSHLSTSMLNVVTVGHRGLYDDFAEVWLLQILGDKNVRDVDPQRLAQTIKTVTRHGPKLESLYLLSCFVFTFELAQPGECLPITLEGIKALPLSWRIPMTQGYISSFVLDDPGSGALYYELAGSRPHAPAYLSSLATKLAARVDMTEGERRDAKLELFTALGLDMDKISEEPKPFTETQRVQSVTPQEEATRAD